MRGGLDKMREAGCVVLGGHSVNDPEIKFGYAVTGVIHPDRIKANSGARVGDALIFTKALGTGVIGTALKRGIASEASVRAAAASMLKLNREACEVMLRFDVHGCTDVTGFGMIGHAREMAVASGVTLRIDTARVPLLTGAVDAVLAGAIPGGLRNNHDFASCAVEVRGTIEPALLELLYDPQTSGGLLLTLAETEVGAFLDAFPAAVPIGRVTARDNKPLVLL
jgi:selenide,water dikinase